MKKHLTLLFIGVLTCLTGYAQYISPTDLIQMHKLWQANDQRCERNTYDYLRTVDKQWSQNAKPTQDNSGYTSSMGYSKDLKQWYKPGECLIMLSYDAASRKRSLVYSFTELDTWNAYLRQMTLMDATKISSDVSGGGKRSFYIVNDIAFVLSEFPPGVNGDDLTYQISIMPNVK